MNTLSHLVVGINGTIGSALFARLLQSGHPVWGTTQRKEAMRQGSVVYLNLLDHPDSWPLPAVKFDVVYLCAGICRMALCEEDPAGTSLVNIEGMVKLAHYLSARGAFIVYLSTNQVFSGEIAHIPEDAPYQPLNEYGRQKAVVEQFIQAQCQPSALVRLTKVVEPNMSLIQNWIHQLQQNQIVEAFHDMMLAPVSLRQVLDVLIHVGETRQPGCYAVSGDEDVSYHTVAQYLADYLGVSKALVRSVDALEKGVKKNFLPRFTTMRCSSTINLCGQKPPQFQEVLHECFNLERNPNIESKYE